MPFFDHASQVEFLALERQRLIGTTVNTTWVDSSNSVSEVSVVLVVFVGDPCIGYTHFSWSVGGDVACYGSRIQYPGSP